MTQSQICTVIHVYSEKYCIIMIIIINRMKGIIVEIIKNQDRL